MNFFFILPNPNKELTPDGTGRHSDESLGFGILLMSSRNIECILFLPGSFICILHQHYHTSVRTDLHVFDIFAIFVLFTSNVTGLTSLTPSFPQDHPTQWVTYVTKHQCHRVIDGNNIDCTMCLVNTFSELWL